VQPFITAHARLLFASLKSPARAGRGRHIIALLVFRLSFTLFPLTVT
jgi:hypothetical protein